MSFQSQTAGASELSPRVWETYETATNAWKNKELWHLTEKQASGASTSASSIGRDSHQSAYRGVSDDLSSPESSTDISIAEESGHAAWMSDFMQHTDRTELESLDDFDQATDDETSIGLLAKAKAQEGGGRNFWELQQRDQDRDIQLYISKERLRGVQRIKQQLTQAAGVFRELALLVNEQQDPLDTIDFSMNSAGVDSRKAVEELRRSHAMKQRSRKRKITIIGILIVALLLVVTVYVTPLLSGPSQYAYGFTPPRHPRPLVAARSNHLRPHDALLEHGRLTG